MKRVEIKTLFDGSYVDKEVSICGWVRSIRKKKKFSFVVVNDGSCQQSIQIIMDADIPNYESLSSLLAGASLSIVGKVVSSGGKGQSIEIHATNGEVLGIADESYPFQKKATSLEFIRENAHLRSRTNLFGAVFRIRNTLAKATHDFFQNQNFYYLNTPIITSIDAEGAGEMFNVSTLDIENPPRTEKNEIDYSKDYFGRSTSLTVSGQLEAECAAMGLGKVYTFGPTFRSEKSYTSRHLSEFWMIEPEVAFADLEDMANLAESYIKALIKSVLDNNIEELNFLIKRDPDLENHLEVLENVLSNDFIKISYTDAIEILNNSGQKFEFPTVWGEELQTEHERYLTEKHFKKPVIVMDYPKDCKAFYMKLNDDGKTVRAMDVLVPGVGELIGGSQREHRLDKLKQRMEDLSMNEGPLWWYLDLRKYGTAPHAGFGLGFERAVMYISGMKNIKDVIPFPRTPNSADF